MPFIRSIHTINYILFITFSFNAWVDNMVRILITLSLTLIRVRVRVRVRIVITLSPTLTLLTLIL